MCHKSEIVCFLVNFWGLLLVIKRSFNKKKNCILKFGKFLWLEIWTQLKYNAFKIKELQKSLQKKINFKKNKERKKLTQSERQKV